jgi:hypothetical protein
MIQYVGNVNGLVVEQHLMKKLPCDVFSSQIVQQRVKDDKSNEFLDSILGDIGRAQRPHEENLKQLNECLEKLQGYGQ